MILKHQWLLCSAASIEGWQVARHDRQARSRQGYKLHGVVEAQHKLLFQTLSCSSYALALNFIWPPVSHSHIFILSHFHIGQRRHCWALKREPRFPATNLGEPLEFFLQAGSRLRKEGTSSPTGRELLFPTSSKTQPKPERRYVNTASHDRESEPIVPWRKG